MTTTTYSDYDAYYDYDLDDYAFSRKSRSNAGRKNKPGKNKRAMRQARFQKETGYLTRREAEAARERFESLLAS